MDSEALAALIEREKPRLLADWERGVRRLSSARDLHTPALQDLIPGLLDEIVTSLRGSNIETPDEVHAAAEHGRHRLALGFDLREVAQEYKLLRRGIVALADRHGMPLQGQTAHHIHGVLDDAITVAISAYVEHRDAEEARHREERTRFLVHDLRSPLAAIHQAMIVIEHTAGAQLPDTARAMLNAVRRNVRHLQAMTIKLLHTERNRATGPVQTLTRWTVALTSVADAAIEGLRPLAEHAGSRIINDIAPDLMVTIDPESIERVFLNLLMNAIEQAPGGAVVVSARRVDGAVEVCVADRGPGVPDAMKDKIFDKFVTTRVGGTGLGLTIARQFVDAHGGTLRVEDHPGDGAVFCFVLPDSIEGR